MRWFSVERGRRKLCERNLLAGYVDPTDMWIMLERIPSGLGGFGEVSYFSSTIVELYHKQR